MNGCGGSIEWTCTVRSVARASVAVGLQRGDHLVGRAEMHVHGGDQVADQAARRQVAGGGEPMAHPGRADLGQPHRLLGVVGDEHRARGEDARLASLGQRLEIGVDHRVLDVGQRAASGASGGRGWVRDSIRPSPAAPARRAPSTLKVACQMRSTKVGLARIQPVAARQRAAPPRRCAAARDCRHQLSALVGVQAERGEGGQVAARPDADFQAAAAHEVEHRGILGHPDRQLQRQGDDAGPEPDARGLRGDLGEEHERRRQAALVLVEVVLGDPGRIEAAALGMHDLRGGQPVALGRGGFVEQTGEKAQFLGRRLGHRPTLSGRPGANASRSIRGLSTHATASRPAFSGGRSARKRPRRCADRRSGFWPARRPRPCRDRSRPRVRRR